MYNRYVQQEDGTFRKSKLTDPALPVFPKEKEQEPTTPTPPPLQPLPQLPPQRDGEPTAKTQQSPPKRLPDAPITQGPRGDSVNSFLKQLLPQDFDTADLIVVLLLLLMSEKDKDSPNTALLTLVIYLFL